MPIIIEGEGRVPAKEDVAIAWNQVRFRIQFLAPETLEIIRERERREKEEQRKFRDDSELLQSGQPDVLGQLHKSSGGRYGGGLFQKTIAAEVRHEHPPRNGWGRYKNMTKAQFADYARKVQKNKEVDDINQAFVDAEAGGNW